MVSAVEMAVNPKKRVFLALVLFSAIMTAVLLFFAWKVTYLGFEAISQFLPAAFGFLVFGAIFFLFAGELAIVLAIMGMPLPKILNIPREKVEQSFVAVNNALVKQHHIKVPSDRLLILTPHCLQLDTCPRKITRNIENCQVRRLLCGRSAGAVS